MLDEIYGKVRALVGDFGKSSFEIFEYTTVNVFTVAQCNISITSVLINGVITSDYTFNTANNKITITASGLISGSKIEVDYTYFSYSTSELKEFVRAALAWISFFGGVEKDLEIEDDAIYPTVDNRTEDMIAIIASILIKPNYTEKKLPNLVVKYPRTMTKEKVIEQLITRYMRSNGICGLIELK